MEWIEAHWKWLFAIANVVFGCVIWALTKQFAKKDDHDHLAGRVETLELTVKTLPDTERLHQLELQMKELSGDLNGLSPLLKRIEYQSNLLLENELGGKS